MTQLTKLKPQQTFTPDSDVSYLFCQYLLTQFEHARSLEQGMLNHVDSEYLHQYRVSLRRCRSLVKLLKDLLPTFEVALIKSHLARLMKQTNALRDLDVFLISQRNYITVKSKHQPAMSELFEGIQHLQIKELERVRGWLQSKEYTAVCVLLNNSLKRSVIFEGHQSPPNVNVYANKQIRNHIQEVRRQSKRLTVKSPDSAIHKVRIEGKKLRYLLEYFAPLYVDSNHADYVTELKLLQDKLGNFNDTSTQLAHFRRLLEQKEQTPDLINALKCLVKFTQHQHDLTKAEAINQIALFRSFTTENRANNPYT